jgi:hypothetical protein
MRLLTIVALAATLGLCLFSCDALKKVDVTLDISGNTLQAFAGYYETTSVGEVQISGTVPKSYTFTARKAYDVVAAQIGRVGTGQLVAKLVSDGVTRDSAATSDVVGTISLHWTP